MRSSTNDKPSSRPRSALKSFLIGNFAVQRHSLIWSTQETKLFTAGGAIHTIAIPSNQSKDRWQAIKETLKTESELLPIVVFLDSPFATFIGRSLNSPEETEKWLKSVKSLPAPETHWMFTSTKLQGLSTMIVAGYDKSFLAEQQKLADSNNLLIHSFQSLRATLAFVYASQCKTNSGTINFTMPGSESSFRISRSNAGELICEEVGLPVTVKDIEKLTIQDLPLLREIAVYSRESKVASISNWREVAARTRRYGIATLYLGLIFLGGSFLIPNQKPSTALTEKQLLVDSLTRELALLPANDASALSIRQKQEVASLFAALCQKRVQGVLLDQMSFSSKDQQNQKLLIQGSATTLSAAQAYLDAHNESIPSYWKLRVDQFTPFTGQQSGRGYKFVASNESTTR